MVKNDARSLPFAGRRGRQGPWWGRILALVLGAVIPPVAGAEVTLSWADNSNNESGFEIERAVGSSAFSLLATVGENVTSYRDATVTPGMSYNYRVRAFNTAGASSYSNTALASIPAGANQAPTISSIGDRFVPVDGSTGPIAFTVGDAETAAGSLTVTVTTSNSVLVPTSAITLGGSGANRTLSVTPVAGRSGSATLTVTVSDGELENASAFTLTVSSEPGATIAETDGFASTALAAAQSGTFTMSVNATPSAFGLDALLGLAFGTPATFDDLAVIVRFNTSGFIDVRDGDAYRADAAIGYAAGATYAFRIIVDVDAHTYSVFVTLPGGAEVPLATNYAFRTAQGAVTALDSWFGWVGNVHPGATLALAGIQIASVGAFPEPEPEPEVAPAMLNLSSRVAYRHNGESLIPGFVISGTTSKRVLLRAVGPSLGSVLGVPGSLPNPRMTLKRWNGSMFVDHAVNDDWASGGLADQIRAASQQVSAFPLEEGGRDAALLVDLAPGQYTIVTEDASGANGLVLVEIYDADEGANSRLINLSTRGYVGLGDQVMISGFVVSGSGPRTLLIRAVGPGLEAAFNVAGSVADPMIEVYRRQPNNTDVKVLTQDNWGDDPNAEETAAVAEEVYAFPLAAGSKDAAVVATFDPGIYTVIVRGVNGATGSALVEVYYVE